MLLSVQKHVKAGQIYLRRGEAGSQKQLYKDLEVLPSTTGADMPTKNLVQYTRMLHVGTGVIKVLQLLYSAFLSSLEAGTTVCTVQN
jgi:hypothetical protein